MMTLKEPQTKELVEVIFDDPAEFDTNYDKNLMPIECRTIGWLEDRDKTMVRISWLKETNNAPYVGLTVPIGCVKKIRYLSSNQIEETEGLN